jgi:hypothetical protein
VVTPWPTILDGELLAIRARHAAQLTAEHQRIAAERQRAEDARIVAAREARVTARRWHNVVREVVTS